MTTLTEGKHAGEFIVSCANKTRSMTTGTVLSGSTLVPGQVLGIVTASGKYAPFNQDGVDGTEAAAGIAYDHVDASAADVVGAVIVARDAEVNSNELTWPGDIDAGEQTAAEAELAALGIIVRT